MTHKDRGAKEYRLWIRPDTIRQVKALATILDRNDWAIVLDDCIRLGVYYLNRSAGLQLTDWEGFIKLFNSQDELGLRIVKGALPDPGVEALDE